MSYSPQPPVPSSTHVDVIFLSLVEGSVWLVFSSFSVGIIPYVVDLVCPWDQVSSGSSYVTILALSSSSYLEMNFKWFLL